MNSENRAGYYARFYIFSFKLVLPEDFPKMNLTSGPATKSCQKKAIGKFLTTSSQNVANICELKPPLKRMVAIKLIIGHINQIEKTEIARIIAIGLSFPGVTILKAHFWQVVRQ